MTTTEPRRLLQESRSRFFDIDAPGMFCIGNKAECDYLEDHAIRLPWAATPTPSQREQIQVLHILPTPAQAKKAILPDFISSLPNLTSLAFPAPYLAGLPEEGLPAIRSLHIDLDPRWVGQSGERLPVWPPSLNLPSLEGLMFRGTYGASRFWTKLHVTPHHLPSMEFFDSDIDAEGEGLEQLAKMPTLRHIELGYVSNQDLFSRMHCPLEYAALSGSGRDFPFGNIVKWPKLKALFLNSIRAEIDCDTFCRLPELKEIRLVSCKRLLRPEALLRCEQLQNLDVTDCGNPFKHGLMSRFEERGFERLNIRYS